MTVPNFCDKGGRRREISIKENIRRWVVVGGFIGCGFVGRRVLEDGRYDGLVWLVWVDLEDQRVRLVE